MTRIHIQNAYILANLFTLPLLHITRRRKIDVEIGKLSKQLEEVKSLLCEVTKHLPHQQGAPEALDEVSSDARDDQPC